MTDIEKVLKNVDTKTLENVLKKTQEEQIKISSGANRNLLNELKTINAENRKYRDSGEIIRICGTCAQVIKGGV